MDYENIYFQLCERGKRRQKVKKDNLEKHHIIPTFFYKDTTRNLRHKDGIYEGSGEHIGNFSYLTPREHFIAHLLLCKIWKNTKWEYRCYLSIKMFLNGGKINDFRNVFDYSSRKYERYKTKANAAISRGKSGTMPAKHAVTGERLGIVKTDDPRVISGEWVHITKGKKCTDEQRKKYSKPGLMNHNSKYTDKDLYDSFKKCCLHYGKIVKGSLWHPYSERNGLPYIKFMKKFRFNGRGYAGLLEDLKKDIKDNNLEIEIVENYHSKEWRDFVKKERNKWE